MKEGRSLILLLRYGREGERPAMAGRLLNIRYIITTVSRLGSRALPMPPPDPASNAAGPY